MDDAIIAMRQEGLTSRQIAQRLNSDYGIETATEPTYAPENDESAKIRAAASTKSDVAVPKPTFSKDICANTWIVTASFSWSCEKNLSGQCIGGPWKGDVGSTGCSSAYCNIGGDDGFGFAFNRNVSTVRGYKFTTWGAIGSIFPKSTDTGPDSAGTSGAVFVGQDRWSKTGSLDNSWARGQLVYTIGSPGCGKLEAYSRLAHTRSGADITGFSIGVDSVGLSWSPTNKGWTKTSQPSNTIEPC